ncbi:substrate-binding domain-containing protein [Paracoccus sp. (in: a-proteobacteria)]|uniref:substrate-binding domain-containing protein n=1 Tax=Paracoccus sp. TaxID=267 RepID=UPI003A892727
MLARPELPLIARMRHEFQRLTTLLDASIIIHRTILKDERPETIARALGKTTCDAVIAYMPDDPAIHAAVAALRKREIPVVTLISDVPESARIAYAGPDHFQSGRSAGYFITRMVRQPGPVAVLCNTRDLQSHDDRIRGLEAYLSGHPEFSIAAIVEGRDDRDRSETRLRQLFRQCPDIVAVYNVGAGNLGVAAAIRADILPERPVFVGHELTRYSAALLSEGIMSLTIDQNPELQARLAVNQILHHFDFADLGQDSDHYGIKPLQVVLYGPENIPEIPQV